MGQINKLILEEVERFNRIKFLEEKKKMLEESIKKMEDGNGLNEWLYYGKPSKIFANISDEVSSIFI
jgi:hypothetical protein